ncbi:hypothetical protein HYY75_03345, partial [bacterium]|nr:hypothetical protein [bacterium]
MLKPVFYSVFFLLLSFPIFGMGSLKIEGSVFKKSVYTCVIRTFAEDYQSRLWVGTFGAGLWVKDGKGWRKFGKSPSALPDERISKIVVHKNELFIATAGGGICSLNLSDLSWKQIKIHTDLSNDEKTLNVRHFHALGFLGERQMLLGAVGEGLFYFNGEKWSHFTDAGDLPNNWVNDVMIASNGAWVATFGGIAFFSNG